MLLEPLEVLTVCDIDVHAQQIGPTPRLGVVSSMQIASRARRGGRTTAQWSISLIVSVLYPDLEHGSICGEGVFLRQPIAQQGSLIGSCRLWEPKDRLRTSGQRLASNVSKGVRR